MDCDVALASVLVFSCATSEACGNATEVAADWSECEFVNKAGLLAVLTGVDTFCVCVTFSLVVDPAAGIGNKFGYTVFPAIGWLVLASCTVCAKVRCEARDLAGTGGWCAEVSGTILASTCSPCCVTAAAFARSDTGCDVTLVILAIALLCMDTTRGGAVVHVAR